MRENAQKVVANDLKTWQEKFAKAADEGSDELEQRITEISEKLIEKQAHGVGEALITQLEETTKSSLKALRKDIIAIVKDSVDNESVDTEASEEALATAVRKAGIAIKPKAQAVRTWRQNFDEETNSLIAKAASDTFEILDHIRDLGLQEVGMRWAWTDGITHKDWTKYHKLKGKFDEWRVDVEKAVVEHPGLGNARAASEEVENTAMTIAEEAAKELARLKETGRWKISVGDVSDDFSTKHMPAAAASVKSKVTEKIKDATETVAHSSQGTMESAASAASSSVTEAISSASSTAASQVSNVKSAAYAGSSIVSDIVDEASSTVESQQGSVESIASVAKASVGSIVDQLSSSVIGTSQGTIESIVSAATESASTVSEELSSPIADEQPSTLKSASESVKSAAAAASDSASDISEAVRSSVSTTSSTVSSATSAASSSVDSAASPIASPVLESSEVEDSSISSAASSVSDTASKKVWGGAVAQVVEARQIVYEDIIEDSNDESFSEMIQSMASEAGDRYADITNAVSEALLKPSATQGSLVTKLAAQQYSSALAAASSALYGTDEGVGERIATAASSRYASAVAA